MFLERLNRLRVDIARADNFAIGPSCGGTRYVDVRANSNRTRVTDNGLPRCAAGNLDSLHFASFGPDPII